MLSLAAGKQADYGIRPEESRRYTVETKGGTDATLVLFEAAQYWGYTWHYQHKGNVAFADSHVEFMPMPKQFGEYSWDP